MLPLALALALALLTLYLERAVREEDKHPALRRHDPDYIVEKFRVTTYDRDGQAQSMLSADKMLHFPDDDTTELTAPRIVQTRSGQSALTLTADRGTLSGDGEELFLYDNVLLVRAAASGQPEARMQTSFLHVVRERSLVRTDREVAFTEGSRFLQGKGMQYDNETRRLELLEDVRGRFETKALP